MFWSSLSASRAGQDQVLKEGQSVFAKHVWSCSVGAHVRDAAAYVCWAFARAYTAADLADSITVVAPALLVTACYDREVCLRCEATVLHGV